MVERTTLGRRGDVGVLASKGPMNLAGRPSPDRMTVQALLERVREGRLRVPAFQRPLRWKPKDAELLVDSLVRGYPVGTLLLWKRAAKDETVRLGGVSLQVEERRDALWVVDGQQRITALVNVLFPPDIDPEPRRPFLVEWDLGADGAVRSSTPATPGGIRVPLDRVVDAADLSEWVHTMGFAREDARRVFELGRIIREYEILAYVVETSDEQVLRRVFARTNTSGKKLRADEVFNALHGRASDSGLSDFRTLGEALEPLGFGAIQQRWLHQAALAVAGVDATTSRPGESQIADDAIAQAYAPLQKTVTFLMDDAQIPCAELLPYGLVIPVLAAFFRDHPSPNERSRELLRRWLWRGAVTGAHRGDVIPERRKNFQAIDSDDEEGSVQNLLKLVAAAPHPLSTTGGLNPRNAASRLWMLVLASFDPRDLTTGDPVDLCKLVASQRSWSRLPSLVPKWSESQLPDLPMLVANRLLSAPGSSETLESLRIDSTLRDAHCVPDEVLDLLARGQTIDAIRLRADLIRTRASTLLASRARWGESDRPSIAYLVREPDVA